MKYENASMEVIVFGDEYVFTLDLASNNTGSTSTDSSPASDWDLS